MLAELTFACVLWVIQGYPPLQKCETLPLVAPVAAAALKYSSERLPAEVIASTINYESHYKQYARSPRGAAGLMQVLRNGAVQGADLKLTFTELCDIDTNVRIGSSYLKDVSRHCARPMHYLTWYHQGHGCTRSSYSDSVLRDLRRGRSIVRRASAAGP